MTLDLQPGASFGEYTLERRLGGGGFGDVWLSRDSAGAPVALKVLHGQYQSSEAARLRAEIELLAAAASSRSEHIVRVIDGGSEPAPYIVMEYIQGTDLGREIARRGALPVAEVLRIAEGIADALATLQQAGIIHRDIKPANVMIDTQGVVKLTDFGIAKIVGVDSITTTNNIAMSVAYAAPEAFEGKISRLSDYYAFGALLYQLLTGRALFSGTYIEVMHHHVFTMPSLDALPPDTPYSLRNLLAACLDKEADLRPSSALTLSHALLDAKNELIAALEPTLRHEGLTEPRQLGPWVIDTRNPDRAWTFVCHHESTGDFATIRIHFTDDLQYGQELRRIMGSRTSRFVLRPGEGFQNLPHAGFMFWTAQSPHSTRDVDTSARLRASPVDPDVRVLAKPEVQSPPPPEYSRFAAAWLGLAMLIVLGMALSLYLLIR